MKTVYIPKGETVHYESLATEHLVVHGRLHVTYGVKAQSITGSGVIDAGSINADTVCIDDAESGTVICKRLIAKRVQAPEVFASESAAVLLSISCWGQQTPFTNSHSISPEIMSFWNFACRRITTSRSILQIRWWICFVTANAASGE